MNSRRIYGVLLQEFFITRHSLEVVIDVFFFPIVNIAIFGFISLYLAGNQQETVGHSVLLGMILWQIIWVIQYSVTVGSLWNIWSRNLSNMFIAPLMLSEYIFAHFLSGIIKAIILLGVSMLVSTFLFGFNPLDIGIVTVALVFVVFAMFAFAVGISILGVIFRYGTRISALSWSVITIFQPLSAAFFPLSVMPHALQTLAYFFPPTYAFEAARYALVYHTVNWSLFINGLMLDALYCAFAIILFKYLFDASRNSGQFARNEV